MCMSVRGVMMCDTYASPSSMTPSIISRASSSSSPSRWPSLTIVRISSSIDSSSASLRRAAEPCDAATHRRPGRTTRAAARAGRRSRHSGQVRVQKLARADPRDRPRQPHVRPRPSTSPSTTRRCRTASHGCESLERERLPRPQRRRRPCDSAASNVATISTPSATSFVMAQNLAQTARACRGGWQISSSSCRENERSERCRDCGKAGRQQRDDRNPEQHVGVHDACSSVASASPSRASPASVDAELSQVASLRRLAFPAASAGDLSS